MFDGKKIVRSVVALVSAVAMLAGLSFVAPSALAANNLSCAQGTIYGINSGNDRSIYSINTTTGATAKVPGGNLGNSANGLGINKDGSAAYAVEQNPGTVSGGGGHGGGGSTVTYPDSVKILKYDANAQPTPSSASVGTIDLQSKVTGLVSAYLVGGAVSPFNDIFYFGGWTSNAKFALYGWDTAKDQSIGLLGYITADTNPSLLANANGDLAFDASGNLYLVNSLGDPSKTKTPQQIEVRIPAASVPTAAVTSDITATQVAKGTEAVDFNGVAYDGSGTFYMSTTSAIVPGFGNKAINFTGGLSTVDLASCSLPAPPTAHDATVPANSDGSATLTPDVTPGASPITSGSFDNGQTSKKVDGQGTWNITVDPDGKPTVTFTPEDGFTGTPDSQTYTVADKNGLTSDPANLTVTKPAPQDPPTTGNASKAINPNQTATLNPVTTPGSGDITGVEFVAPADGEGSLSADGRTLTVPGEGVWTIALDNGQPVATFAPDKDYSGPVTEQQYTVTDSNDKTATGKLDVTINEPPTASDKSATTDPGKAVTLDPETGFGTSQKFTGVAFDKSGATTKDVPGEGSWTIALNDKGQPEAVFTPVDGFTGKTTPVPYIVTDENGLTATANWT
jgi:CshA-type fibril repeat protein